VAVVSMKALLETGVHFGHRTQRWNPKMKPFIFTERNGIHIIDLQQTIIRLGEAYNTVRDTVSQGGTILFVGTKRQAQDSIAEQAQRCGMPYVNQRWLGGTLTNWRTIRQRIDYLLELENRREIGEFDRLPKKEVLKLERRSPSSTNAWAESRKCAPCQTCCTSPMCGGSTLLLKRPICWGYPSSPW